MISFFQIVFQILFLFPFIATLQTNLSSSITSIQLNYDNHLYFTFLQIGTVKRKVIFSTVFDKILLVKCIGNNNCLQVSEEEEVEEVCGSWNSCYTANYTIVNITSVGDSIINKDKERSKILVYNIKKQEEKNLSFLNVSTEPFEGFLGASFLLQGKNSSNFWSFFNFSSNDLFYALDLNAQFNKESFVYIGEIPNDYVNQIIWSEPLSSISPFSINVSFNAFNLSICNVSLLSNLSSYWNIVVSTERKCLSLPETLFNVITQWIPILLYDEERKLSYFIKQKNSILFPSFTFQLTQGGEIFYVFLNKLFLYENTTFSYRQYLCLSKTETIKNKELFIASAEDSIRTEIDDRGYTFIEVVAMKNYPIIFGTMVLESFLTVIDMKSYKVGLAQKDIRFKVNNSNSQCNQPRKCYGEKSILTVLNTCEELDCSLWYFNTRNQQTKMCVVNPMWLFVFIILLILFTLAEVLLYFRKRHLIFRVLKQRRTDLIPSSSSASL